MAVPVSGPAAVGAQTPPKKLRIRRVVLNLENCILTEEKLQNTPSMQDGLDPDVETDLRFVGCELIQNAGILLKLPQVAMATGQVLYQRFYYSKSFVGHNFEIVAMACVVLASKIEEGPRRVRDVLNVFHHMEQVRKRKAAEPLILDQHYMLLKNQVIKAERRVLKELGFCVHVKHPHKMIVTLLEVVLRSESNDRLVQIAWNYMNDSLRSDIFVRHSPETIACACIFLAARLMQISLPKTPSWYEAFRISESRIEDAASRILSLYSRAKVDVDRVDKIVKDLRAKQQEEKKSKALGSINKVAQSNNDKILETAVITPLNPSSKALDTNASVFYGPLKKPEAVDIKEERHDSSVERRDRYRDRERHREKDRSRDRVREKSRERERDRSRDRVRYRSRERARERSRDRARDRSRERVRDRSRDRSKDYRRRSSSSEDRSSRKKRKRRIHFR